MVLKLTALVFFCLLHTVRPDGDQAALPQIDEILRVMWVPHPARTSACRDGTEFIVTFADDVDEDAIIDSMNGELGSTPDNFCRRLRPMADVDGQLKAMTLCLPSDSDGAPQLETLRNMPGVEAIEQNAALELHAVPWHLDRIDQVCALPTEVSLSL